MTNMIKHLGGDIKGKASALQGTFKEHGVVGSIKQGGNALGKGLKDAWHHQPALTGVAAVTAAYFAVNAYRGRHARRELARIEAQQQDLGVSR